MKLYYKLNKDLLINYLVSDLLNGVSSILDEETSYLVEDIHRHFKDEDLYLKIKNEMISVLDNIIDNKNLTKKEKDIKDIKNSIKEYEKTLAGYNSSIKEAESYLDSLRNRLTELEK